MTLISRGIWSVSPKWRRLTISKRLIFDDVKTKREIVEHLANTRRVEAMVQNICHQELNQDLKDLCQMIYVILLEYDEDKIQDLWENNEINFFLARIILNQYRSSNSPFHALFRKMQERSVSLGSGVNIDESVIEYLNRNFKPRKER